jgi:hypothetical protein
MPVTLHSPYTGAIVLTIPRDIKQSLAKTEHSDLNLYCHLLGMHGNDSPATAPSSFGN